jgi:hypothetical protein
MADARAASLHSSHLANAINNPVRPIYALSHYRMIASPCPECLTERLTITETKTEKQQNINDRETAMPSSSLTA